MSNDEILEKINRLRKEIADIKEGKIVVSKCENYTRCVGYWANYNNMNPGKLAEVKERIPYDLKGELK